MSASRGATVSRIAAVALIDKKQPGILLRAALFKLPADCHFAVPPVLGRSHNHDGIAAWLGPFRLDPMANASLPASPLPPARSLNRLWGLFTRRERWGLSLRGWLAVGLCSLLVCLALVLGIHPFLAVTHREPSAYLVVEGWVHRYAIEAAAREQQTGNYLRVLTTGGPVAGEGAYTSDFNTSASVGAGLLRKAGVSADMVQMVPSRVNGRDRTYSSAVALREWFREHRITVSGINVLTEGLHARRTRLLFKKAFGDGVKVGIIAVPNPDYDPRRWWLYSEGVREVLGESIAYLYARLFFHPSEATALDCWLVTLLVGFGA